MVNIMHTSLATLGKLVLTMKDVAIFLAVTIVLYIIQPSFAIADTGLDWGYLMLMATVITVVIIAAMHLMD